MSTKILVPVVVLCAVVSVPLRAQSKLNFNIGGGISTPLNPTGAYTGVSGNFNLGAGYNINKKNTITGEFMWSGLPPSVFTIHPLEAPSGNIRLTA